MIGNRKCPFDQWFNSLEEDDQLMVDYRIACIRQGTFGEINSVGNGVWELKFRKGKAIRVYYAKIGKQVLLLVCGGDKRSQKGDILRARTLFGLYKKGQLKDEVY